MVRFFVLPADISGGFVLLSSEDSAHIRSLRLRPDELFIVCDGEGSDHVCRLALARDQEAGDRDKGTKDAKSQGTKDARGVGSVAEIVETRPSLGEPSVVCTVYIALAKGERLDYAVQKSVELGARDIVLFSSARCVAVPGEMSKKTARLQRIALETAKQCGRGRVPGVTYAGALGEMVGNLEFGIRNSESLPLFFYEFEERVHLKQVLEKQLIPDADGVFMPVSIVTGPEGGFEPFEAESAQSAGMIAVSLGPRILRCETAPVAALAAVMYHTGNL